MEKGGLGPRLGRYRLSEKLRSSIGGVYLTVEELLKSCYAVRYTLRKKKVPLSLYEKIALQLNAMNVMSEPVTGVQCREKVRWLKTTFEDVKKVNAGETWECGAMMKAIFDAPLDEVPPSLLAGSPENSQPFGTTYVVSHPKFTFLGASATPTSSASVNADYEIMEQSATTDQEHPKSVEPFLGRTYVVQDPKYVTSESSNGPSDNYTFVSPNDEVPVLIDVEPQNEPEESNPFEDLNTTILQSSTLPSETFFVRNLNLKSTPEKDNSAVPQSPAKKKTINGEAGIRTPRSTPKRKKRYQTESWLPGVTHALLKECLARKEQVQTGNPPTSLWKEVSNTLAELGFTTEWQACREKFESMNIFFERSLIKVNGIIGQTKWPYYECFLQIHDLPANHIQPAGESTHDSYYENEEEDSKLWGDQVVELLISLYRERRHLFKSSKSCIRHNTLYQEIAAIMKIFDYDRSYKQCQRKMNKLLDQFRKEFDREGRTGEAPSTWKWFKTIMEMEEGSPNLNAPFAFSVGALTQYSVEGAHKPVAEKRNTRTRITANVSHTTVDDEGVDNPQAVKEKGAKGKKEVPKKQLYKSWAQQVQEKSADAQMKTAEAKVGLVEEVRLLRLTQTENNAPKNEALKTMAAAMLDISAYCRSLSNKN